MMEINELEKLVEQLHGKFKTSFLSDQTFGYLVGLGDSRAPKYKTNKKALLNDYEEYIRAVSREYWVSAMHSKGIMRYLSALSAVLGLILLSLPSLDIFHAVSRELVKSLLH